MEALWNGQAYCAIFRVEIDHSGIVIPAGTGGVVATPTLANVALLLTDAVDDIIVESSEWTPDANGICTVTVNSNNHEIPAFLEVAAPAVAGGAASITKKEYTSEKGKKIGGAGSSSGIPYLVISATSYNSTHTLVNMAIVTISPESGKMKSVVSDTTMWSIKMTSVAAKAAFVIDQDLFDTDLFNATISAGLRTIPISAYYKASLIPVP